MSLFYVQDSDRPLWIVAANWAEALLQWQEVIKRENNGECDDGPQGIQYICPEDELVINGVVGSSQEGP